MSAAIGFDELAVRLQSAARMELFGLNQMEQFCARVESDTLRELSIGEARRQAEALALAGKIALALAAKPELALGLGLDAEQELARE